jgi:hypothetical protein
MKIDRGNRSTRRKPAPAPLCPPQIPLDQTRDSGLLPSGFPTNILYGFLFSPIRATCPAYLILIDLLILIFILRKLRLFLSGMLDAIHLKPLPLSPLQTPTINYK